MDAILQQIKDAAGPLLTVYLALAGTVLLDFLSGVYAAATGGTFDFKYIGAFIKDHFALKVVPIMGAFAFAYALGGTATPAGAALLTTAGGLLAAYEVATIKSIMDNFGAASAKTGNLPESVTPTIVAGETVELEAQELNLSDAEVDRIAARLAAKLGPGDTN